MPIARTRVTAAAIAAAVTLVAPACGGWIEVTGPVTRIGDGEICVDADNEVPGGGCSRYSSESDLAGIAVGDCVTMRLYSESARFHDVNEIDCDSL